MKTIKKIIFFVVALLLPLSLVIGGGRTGDTKYSQSIAKEAGSDKSKLKTPVINWFNGTQDAFRDSAVKRKKPAFIYIFIDTWDACKGFENNVLADSGTIAYVDTNFMAFQINMEFNPNEAMKFMIDEVPAVILFDKSGKEIDRLQGYQSVADFRKFLKKAVK